MNPANPPDEHGQIEKVLQGHSDEEKDQKGGAFDQAENAESMNGSVEHGERRLEQATARQAKLFCFV